MSARLEEVQHTLTKEPGNRLLGVVLAAFDKHGTARSPMEPREVFIDIL